MARPKKQLNRRTDILDAAQILFTEKGFEKTTIDDIVKHIGIGKGTVYLEFKNKNDILLAIIERDVEILLEKIELQIKDAKPPYLELLEQVLKNDITTVFDMATSQIHTHIALMHTSYQIKQELNHLMVRGRNIIATLLVQAAKNDEIKPFHDYENLAQLIKIALQGFLPPYDLNYSLDHRNDLNKQEIRTLLFNDASIVIKLILSGLKVPAQ
ncbi:MAG: TetR/AcrR family transcriptional regulator [bacterium]